MGVGRAGWQGPPPNRHTRMSSANTQASGAAAYKRILLKASGEALMGAQAYGVDVAVARAIAEEIKAVHDLGVEVAVVVGGGNIFRGVSESARHGRVERRLHRHARHCHERRRPARRA